MDRRYLKRIPIPGDLGDPRGFRVLAEAWLEHGRAANLSKWTTYNFEKDLRYFFVWCELRGLTRPQEVTRPILERYQRWLFHYRKSDGKPLTFHSQKKRIVAVQSFFRWLTRENHLLSNPASDLDLPRLEVRLPKHILTAAEADRVMAVVDVAKPRGLRDRAVLEILYSTGMRRAEVCALKLQDFDAERGVITVRQGKGKKDRTVPIGERAIAWVEKYLREVRPAYVSEPDDGTVFLSTHQEAFGPGRLTRLVHDYIEEAGIGKSGSCHLFRHTMATLMLENGAELRFVQHMLGHAHVTTTEIYTHVAIRKLKEVHAETHPGAKLVRTNTGAAEDRAAARAEILAALEDEAAQDGDERRP